LVGVTGIFGEPRVDELEKFLDIDSPVYDSGRDPDEMLEPMQGFWAKLHPIGWVAVGLLLTAAIYHTVLSTKYMIGNFRWWQWVALLGVVALSAAHGVLNQVRLGIELISSVTKTIAWILAWVVFAVQLFNVVTRYGNEYVDQDILIGQMTSLAWQSFAVMFLLGANYGIRDAVNPRIDFWWADFSHKVKARLDFVLHVTLFLPFVFVAARMLRGYAATSLGQKRSGVWPDGWHVWNTWEQSPDADQLPVGPIKAMLLVAFVLIGLQIIAEIIKTGFVWLGRSDFGDIREHQAPQRIE